MADVKGLIIEYIDENYIYDKNIQDTAEIAIEIALLLQIKEKKFGDIWNDVHDIILEYSMDQGFERVILPYSKSEIKSAVRVQNWLKLLRSELKGKPQNFIGHGIYEHIEGKLFEDSDKIIKSLDQIILGVRHPPNRTDGERKQCAAKFAYNLLRRVNLRAVSTKGSKFCKVAATLYGTPQEDFHHVCREFLKSQK